MWKAPHGRKSDVVWEENNIVPKLVLEVVSETYGHEYDDKMTIYAKLGVLYYVIYNPQYAQRHQHDPFEVYRLVDVDYMRQWDEPCWMPEIGLGIGRAMGVYKNRRREWLYWYDEKGKRFKTPLEKNKLMLRQKERAQQKAKMATQQAEQELQRADLATRQAEQERQRADKLAKMLQEMGIDPNS